MSSDEKDKNWGTIYMDAGREATLSKLDAMQAASRQEQWNQRTQNDYLEKVRAKATERARQILGEAYTERQKILEEAQEDGRRIRLEAQVEYAKAEETLAEAQKIREAAQVELDEATAVRNASQEDGFNAGLHQAQQELEEFRTAMGGSVAGVLRAIEGQCMSVFEGWRQEITALIKVCVEKATGLVLDEQYQLILEHLVLEAVRQLDDRRLITIRVHPDDESAVADMFAAAKEKMPNLGQWVVTGDPALELGGLIAESQSGSVDSRLELFQELVQNILEHLTLPGSNLDSAALSAVEEAVRQEAANIAALAPPPPLPEAPAPELPHSTPEAMDQTPAPSAPEDQENPELLLQDTSGELAPEELAVEEVLRMAQEQHFADDGAPSVAAAPPAAPEFLESAAAPPPEAAPEGPAQDSWSDSLPPEQAQPESPAPAPAQPAPSAAHEPTREELEEELLPIPPDMEPQLLHEPSPLDEVLAGGGFLDAPAPVAQPKDRA